MNIFKTASIRSFTSLDNVFHMQSGLESNSRVLAVSKEEARKTWEEICKSNSVARSEYVPEQFDFQTSRYRLAKCFPKLRTTEIDGD